MTTEKKNSQQTGGAQKGFSEQKMPEADFDRAAGSSREQKKGKAENPQETQAGHTQAQNYLICTGNGQQDKTREKETRRA